MASKVDFIEMDGVKVPFVFEQDSRLPLVSMQMVFRNSGSLDEGSKAGLARLSAKVLMEGSRKRGAIGFADAIESRAISLESASGNETLILELESLTEEFDTGLGLLGELLRDPNLTDASLAKMKKMTLSAIARQEDDYDTLASNALNAQLFPKTPLALPNIGTKSTVTSIQLKDVQRFIHEHIVLSRVMIIIGGDIDLETAKARVRTLLKTLPKGRETPLAYYETHATPTTQILHRPTTEQAYIYFGSPFHLHESSPDLYKARIAFFILGAGGFGSRLMEEIRVKRGLAYSTYARASMGRSCNYFSGYLQTKLESQEEAKALVASTIETFVREGVTQRELDQAKKFMIGSEPLRVETLSQRLGRTYGEFYAGKPLGSSVAELESIRTLSLEDLNAFIHAHPEITQLSYAILTR